MAGENEINSVWLPCEQVLFLHEKCRPLSHFGKENQLPIFWLGIFPTFHQELRNEGGRSQSMLRPPTPHPHHHPQLPGTPAELRGAEQRVWSEQWNGFHRKPIQAVIFRNKWLRRNMIEVYKMRSSSEIVNRQWFFIICHYSRQKWNKMKLWTSSSKQPRRRTFPSQLIIKSYSSLPQRAASAKSINFFKRN